MNDAPDQSFPVRIASLVPLAPIARAEFARRFIIEDAEPASLGTLCPDVLLLSPAVRVDAAFLAGLPASVGALATYSVGLDHIDLDAVRARGLPMFNTPGILSNAVADQAMLLLLAATRRMAEATALLREGRWTDLWSSHILGVELAGRTLGIYGLGDIGRRVARRATAFGMRLVYHNRRRAVDEAGATFAATAEEFLASADILLLAAPSTGETRNFLNRERLALARDGLVVVNIGRGDLIDDDALLEALESGKVRAAGLDVFRNEPQIDPRFLARSDVVATPHIGSATEEARRGMATVLCDAIEAWRRGERPANRIT
ncbi:D-isomer specific 2-hydroxyacid dehydrogenase, NAD-binding [Rhizorhabdus wittichii RW1]|uniref:D-isomer specific 2-hydroxyacid dehydrogenase, NAD-binding n=1 Tax=Rhizorhabdus wittichii (strain DSM 6014 / CCUG 31198 / JCM 15750 / NBRC 105917 / EY 4224 / RW1) TaxID=392499 RepID=A0A9J9HAI2_RHIWR|nr:D-isomer specific 2-hydroxyacid dehydrogenase, NAD-binding [Rhizorhabdus wittichii RW1]